VKRFVNLSALKGNEENKGGDMSRMIIAPAKRGVTNRIERRGLMDALDQSQALIWFDAVGLVADSNENAQKLFGYSARHFLDQDYYTLCHPSKPASLSDKREWQRAADGEMYHTERCFMDAERREIWASVNYAAIRNEAGITRRVMAIFIDLNRFSWKPNDISRVP